MHSRRLAIIAISTGLALAAACATVGSGSTAAHGEWRTPSKGLEIRTMRAPEVCRKGPDTITVLRVDPTRWRFDLFSQAETAWEGPGHIEVWNQRTAAPVLFNAGQYYPGMLHMGLFLKDGRNLGSSRLASWKGVLVAEPVDGADVPHADIIDLELDAFDPETTPYRVAVQSFMILDRNGKKRVRRSDWHASRTVVGTDRSGRILVLHTDGAYTLWEIADWLHASDLDVRHAMSMDGGFEAQIFVRLDGVEHIAYGRWHVDDAGDHSLPGIRKPIPAVIGLYPRTEKTPKP